MRVDSINDRHGEEKLSRALVDGDAGSDSESATTNPLSEGDVLLQRLDLNGVERLHGAAPVLLLPVLLRHHVQHVSGRTRTTFDASKRVNLMVW